MAMRTFLALDLDEPTLDGLEQVRPAVDDAESKISWVARANLHLTLNFLGDVPDDILVDVCNIASAAAESVANFEYEVRGVRCVPPRGLIRMFWADVIEPTGRLQQLHNSLDAAFAGLGLRQEERGFRPHITLARVKYARNPDKLRRAAGQFADFVFGSQHADELIAYGSQLTPQGPIYTPIARAPLG